jgi:4-oxalocrotonate tautomerase
MPFIRVSLLEGRSAEQKRATAQAITEAMVAHCNAPRDHVYVVFEDIAKTDWVAGGRTVAEIEGGSD